MLPNQLPSCVCGNQSYSANGGTFAPDYVSQWFICDACGRHVLMTGRSMLHLLFPTKPGNTFPQEGLDWVNTKLDIFSRAEQDRIQKLRDAWREEHVWHVTNDKMGFPRGTKVGFTYDPEIGSRHFLQAPDGTEIAGEDAPLYKLWHSTFEALLKGRPSFQDRTKLPPQIPDCIRVKQGFYTGNGEECDWSGRIGPDDTKDIPVPLDPRRVAHDEFFWGVFAELRKVGLEFGDVKEIPNEYHNDVNNSEPWYTFTVGAGRGKLTFKVGPRKRVTSISVSKKQGSFSMVAIAALAARDKVTFYFERALRSKKDGVRSILIHAWKRETLVEYLTTLLAL